LELDFALCIEEGFVVQRAQLLSFSFLEKQKRPHLRVLKIPKTGFSSVGPSFVCRLADYGRASLYPFFGNAYCLRVGDMVAGMEWGCQGVKPKNHPKVYARGGF